jgi:hypothetical protein
MASINIQLPAMDAQHSIEIQVKVNGEKKIYNYRIEILRWEDCRETDNQAQCLKELIGKYDQQWRVIQIGNPTQEDIPIMFKQSSH